MYEIVKIKSRLITIMILMMMKRRSDYDNYDILFIFNKSAVIETAGRQQYSHDYI